MYRTEASLGTIHTKRRQPCFFTLQPNTTIGGIGSDEVKQFQKWIEGNDEVKVLGVWGHQPSHKSWAIIEASDFAAVSACYVSRC